MERRWLWSQLSLHCLKILTAIRHYKPFEGQERIRGSWRKILANSTNDDSAATQASEQHRKESGHWGLAGKKDKWKWARRTLRSWDTTDFSAYFFEVEKRGFRGRNEKPTYRKKVIKKGSRFSPLQSVFSALSRYFLAGTDGHRVRLQPVGWVQQSLFCGKAALLTVRWL